MKRLWLLFFLCANTALYALPKEARVPGGIAIFDLGIHKSPPKVWFQGTQVGLWQEADRLVALLGLSLNVKPGPYELDIESDEAPKMTRSFVVAEKKYPTQHIRLKTNTHITLSPENEARAQQEAEMIKGFQTHFEEKQKAFENFQLPAQGRNSGGFGLRRVYNGAPRAPHSGFDIAVPEGSPILAPAKGVVIAVGDYFFAGKTVFIDHQNGLISSYSHLSQTSVQKGDAVRHHQKIGEAGQTGRATGPHLHWNVYLNGVMVDPALFVRFPNTHEKR